MTPGMLQMTRLLLLPPTYAKPGTTYSPQSAVTRQQTRLPLLKQTGPPFLKWLHRLPDANYKKHFEMATLKD